MIFIASSVNQHMFIPGNSLILGSNNMDHIFQDIIAIVMGVFKNPSVSSSLIPLSVIMMCECPALLLVGSLILKETKASY